ncbi:acyl-CoA thioesterase [Variovorax saccharolyticus]|uniref:acyl-CoA thioesterase n=1 Tax=Variovorax saccharolyticus TaxID=3053516 RepID=UPI0025767CD2|nr:acyl-CoA thioesterase II [Variovorax sp. J31P216]MDM0027533.1 acyl-CoA thioesterase II [Variovorax sp. J31P216]
MIDHTTATRVVAELVDLMRLEPLGDDRFRAQSEDIGTPAVFGGQVLGQALMAASRTVEADRPAHSMHAYFLLPGEHAPIDYAVDRVRDGRSFTTRHVVARQGERIIFEMSASFQTVDDGIDHQSAMPPVAGPEGLASEREQRIALGERLPERWKVKGLLPHGLEYRRVDPDDLLTPEPRPAESALWMRAIAALPDDPNVHRALLAYASDHGLLGAAMRPHGLSFMSGQVRPASLDHAMWFHRDFRLDDWLLYSLDSPSASGARGLCRGSIFARDGRLVASTAQEGMLRVRRAGT